MTTVDKVEFPRPTTSQTLMNFIQQFDEYVVGALMTIYNKQEADEQGMGVTAHQNNVGFNGFDAPIMSDMARFYLAKGRLTEKQIAYIRRTIPKYVNQLLVFGVMPLPVTVQAVPHSADVRVNGVAPALKRAGVVAGNLAITFHFPKGDPRFNEMLDKVKSLTGRRWIADEKRWDVPISYDSLRLLTEWGFELSDKAQEAYDSLKAPAAVRVQNFSFDERLKFYQKEGRFFCRGRTGQC